MKLFSSVAKGERGVGIQGNYLGNPHCEDWPAAFL